MELALLCYENVWIERERERKKRERREQIETAEEEKTNTGEGKQQEDQSSVISNSLLRVLILHSKIARS